MKLSWFQKEWLRSRIESKDGGNTSSGDGLSNDWDNQIAYRRV